MSELPTTVIEALRSLLEAASVHNPNDTEKPVSVLWWIRMVCYHGSTVERGAGPSIEWCRGEDLNLHGVTPTST